jgi:hypothetical protein
LRALAYLQSKDGRNARTEFQSILSRRGEVPTSVLYPLSQLGEARAAGLLGDTAGARKSYDAFLAMWKDGDADLQPLKEARLERSALH